MVTGIVLGRVSRIVREKYFKKRQVFVEDYVAAHPEQFVSGKNSTCTLALKHFPFMEKSFYI
jgi:hypothetical protein